jgi:type I restriction enzyme S subunit
VGLWKISQEQVGSIEIPIPPICEQRRIVAKLDELMKVCDRLAERVTGAQSESRRLLDAVLDEAVT